MTKEADEWFLDLRHGPDDPRRQFDQTLRLRRLAKLEQMGPRHGTHTSVWELSQRLEPTLRERSKCGDIRTMHKALTADGQGRPHDLPDS